jgi:hypothetical protein
VVRHGLRRRHRFHRVPRDTTLAQSLSASHTTRTAQVFQQFADEMNARHVSWVIQKELAGDPTAARFPQPAALAEAAHFYFAETDPVFLYTDNGYLSTILGRGQQATYQQIALWLRHVATMRFCDNPGAKQISAQLFTDAADAAQAPPPPARPTPTVTASTQGRKTSPELLHNISTTFSSDRAQSTARR